MRAEPVPVLEMLYRNSEMPRSVRRGLGECLRLLGPQNDDSPGMVRTREVLEGVLRFLDGIEWTDYLARDAAGELSVMLDPRRAGELPGVLEGIMERTLEVHEILTDGFINHQLALE
jgi:hypothetical protein